MPLDLERRKAWRKDYYNKNRTRMDAQNTESKIRNAEKVKERKRRYQASLPIERKMISAARHRAKAKGIEFAISVEDIHVPTHCPITGIELKSNTGGNHPIKSSPNLDRIDNSKGYIPGNVAVISSWANQRKGDLSVEEITKLYQYVTREAK